MAEYVTLKSTSPTGQVIEYRQYPGGGTSLAESAAKVVVSGKTVHSGWSSDGKTYEVYEKAVKEGWTDAETRS